MCEDLETPPAAALYLVDARRSCVFVKEHGLPRRGITAPHLGWSARCSEDTEAFSLAFSPADRGQLHAGLA